MMKSYDIVEWGRPLQAVLREKPAPQGHEVLLAVDACGVCHSDLHIQSGKLDMGDGRQVSFDSLGLKLPFTLGHEIVGRVVAVGPEASIAVGARCVVFPWIGCGQCKRCTSGDELSCESNIALGTRRAGGFSDHVLVPHERYLLDYGDVDPWVAATCACSGLTAFSALRKLPPLTADDALLLIGAGGLGLAALHLAPALTRARLVVADIDEAKLRYVHESTGVEVLNLRNPEAVRSLRERLGEGVRGVLDFVGSPSTLETALQAVGKGATVIVVGLFGGATNLPIAALPSRNLTLRGSYVGSLAEMRELLDLVKRDSLLRVPLTSIPLDDINQALDDLGAGRVQGRVVVIPTLPSD